MQAGNRDAGEGELTRSVVLLYKPPHPGPASSPARLGAQSGGSYASVTPLTGQQPSSPALPPPQLGLICLFPAKTEWAGARIWVFHPLPSQMQPRLRHVRPGAEPCTGTATVQLPPPTPQPREGSERRCRLLSHSHCRQLLLWYQPSANPQLPHSSPVLNWKTLGQALGLGKGQDYVQTSLRSTHGWVKPCFAGSRRGQASVQAQLNPAQLPPHAGGLQHPLAEAPPCHSPPGSGGAQSHSLSFSGRRWKHTVTQTFSTPSLPLQSLTQPQPPHPPPGPSAGPTHVDGGTEDHRR